MIRAVGVGRHFSSEGKAFHALSKINLEVPPGEILLLAGPVGSGKTTLLRVLAGLDEPEVGEVTIAGQSPQERRVGFLFQDYRTSLLPWLNVAANVRLPLEGMRGPPVDAEDRKDIVAGTLDRFGLGALANRRPPSLSGGQAQTVAIARTFVSLPEALFLDEPFSSLDARSAQTILRQIVREAQDRQVPVVLTSHDLDYGLVAATRVAVLLPGQPGLKTMIVSQDFDRGDLMSLSHPALLEAKRDIIALQMQP